MEFDALHLDDGFLPIFGDGQYRTADHLPRLEFQRLGFSGTNVPHHAAQQRSDIHKLPPHFVYDMENPPLTRAGKKCRLKQCLFLNAQIAHKALSMHRRRPQRLNLFAMQLRRITFMYGDSVFGITRIPFALA
ncbi:hypothetical protein D3C81_1200730 [compost metagenome]